jgi:hypothetical protein
MKFIHLYLIGYFLLIFGAGLTLWQAGVLQRVPASWVLIAAVIAVGPGVLLAITSIRPGTITRH